MTKEKNIDIKLSEVENFCKNADSRTVLKMLINYETFLAGIELKIERFEKAINQIKGSSSKMTQENINDLKSFKEKQSSVRKQCDILLDYINKVCGDYDLIKYAIEKGGVK
jgi:archaellum component FlaC